MSRPLCLYMFHRLCNAGRDMQYVPVEMKLRPELEFMKQIIKHFREVLVTEFPDSYL